MHILYTYNRFKYTPDVCINCIRVICYKLKKWVKLQVIENLNFLICKICCFSFWFMSKSCLFHVLLETPEYIEYFKAGILNYFLLRATLQRSLFFCHRVLGQLATGKFWYQMKAYVILIPMIYYLTQLNL